MTLCMFLQALHLTARGAQYKGMCSTDRLVLPQAGLPTGRGCLGRQVGMKWDAVSDKERMSLKGPHSLVPSSSEAPASGVKSRQHGSPEP